ncbi:tetratricopeptide repeat protein [Desulfobacula sp.]|uniref:tetratricopeptide repeat protein n=1 Tax=Desulfobacula sp. TaxID=2593537 RepID=UPI0026117AF9|nr:tetratricopeptide repeat protein [Desulfobacula sp.]
MDDRKIKRKLAAIFSADVKDYSRLMGNNEIETIKSIKACRELLFQKISDHYGRVVDSPGDNILAEFSSVTDAVACAVEIQTALAAHNKDLPDDRKMEFRVGINLGDIIEDDERIYGDGINIAARLEGLAASRGICISGSAYDQVKNKLPFGYEFSGTQKLKNISEPVLVYRVLTDPESAGILKYKCIKDDPKYKRRKRIIAGFIFVFLMVGASLQFKENTPFNSGKHRKIIKQTLMSLKIPDKPSIAVLPFVNMSGDKEQEYFSDGFTEDLITDLSKVSGLFVIARNSVFFYKNKPVKIDEIGHDLGVKYVLEGSVRKVGESVRITAQLIDSKTEGHLWAERYDRDLKDIFSLQDEVREKIVSALAVQMTSDDKKRISMKDTNNLQAYDYYLKANGLCSTMDLDKLAQGRVQLQKAIDLDPNFAKAYAAMGKTFFTQWVFGPDKDPAILTKVFEWAKKAIKINPDEPSGYSILSHYYLWTKQHDAGIEEIKKAIALDPNNPEWQASYGELLTHSNQPEQGILLLKKAMRLDPKHPVWYMYGLGHAYFLIQDYDQAIVTLEKAVEKAPDFWPSYLLLATAYDARGMKEKSRKALENALKENKNLPNEKWEDLLPYKDPAAGKQTMEALKKLGFYK